MASNQRMASSIKTTPERYFRLIQDDFTTLGDITIKGGMVTAATNEVRYMKGWIEASVIEYVCKLHCRLTPITQMEFRK